MKSITLEFTGSTGDIYRLWNVDEGVWRLEVKSYNGRTTSMLIEEADFKDLRDILRHAEEAPRGV